jgi:16S rRNA processing protein RimM
MMNSKMPERTPDYVVIGKVSKPHGIRGELRILPLTEDAHRYKLLQSVFLNKNGVRSLFKIEQAKIVPSAVLLKLDGVPTRTEAENWRNALVEIEGKEVLPLPEGKHYYFELDGLTVETETGQIVGQIVDVLGYPAHDVYVVKSDVREHLIPAVPEIVIKVDTKRQVMVINAIEGLLD